jgi:hypothetical protein
MTLGPEQRARLLRTKLAALVRDAGGPGGEPVDLGASAAVVAQGCASVLIERGSASGLGGALLWSSRQHADELTVFVDDAAAADVARWAGYFELGGRPVVVRQVQGATSHPIQPAPVLAPLPAPQVPAELLEQLRGAGVDVVVEQGSVRGEVLGLEVARLVRWPAEVGVTGAAPEAGGGASIATVAAARLTKRQSTHSPARWSRCGPPVSGRRCMPCSCWCVSAGCARWWSPRPRWWAQRASGPPT